MPPPLKSGIWTYFKLKSQETANCNICNKDYSRKGRTNTSLKNHLKSKHPDEFEMFLTSENDKQQASSSDLTTKSNILTPIQQAKKQLSIEETLQKDKQYDKNHPKCVLVDKLIGEMIAVQDLPFHFVEGIGFRRLMHAIMPKYNLRGHNFFTDYVCKDLYEKVATEIKKIIEQFKNMSFTTDIWSDPSANVSLLSLTCHGITEKFERKPIILKCDTFEERHTGDVIAGKYETMLNEWNISKEQVHCIIRDEGSNIKRAMTLSDFNDIDCTSHKLQLCLKNRLKSHQSLIEMKQKLKKIANHFNHSTIAQKELNAIQDRLNQPRLTVFQDCITRWNSSFYMMERYLKIKDSLSIYSNNHSVPGILPEEWKVMEDCVDLLRPFEESTRELSSSNASISSVIPIIHLLKKKLDEHLVKHGNSGSESESEVVMIHLISTIKTEIAAKFDNIENNFLYTISTYLDPRYKTKFFNTILKEKVDTEILRLLKIDTEEIGPCPPKRSRVAPAENINIRDSNQPSTSSNCRLTLQHELENLLDSSEEESSDTDDGHNSDTILKVQLKQYIKEKKLIVSQNPLDWWRVNEHKYSALSKLIRKFLSPPPASVPSEQLFSSAGIIYKPSRNRLEAEKAAQLLFLKYNLPLIKFQY